MLREEEVKPRKGTSIVEFMGHCMWRDAWQLAPCTDFKTLINWNILPGATAPVLFLHLKRLAKLRKDQGVRVVFGIDFVQNSVLVMSYDQFKDMALQIRSFFEEELGDYHKFFFVNCARCPQLLGEGYGQNITEINQMLEMETGWNGFRPCDPAKTLERKKSSDTCEYGRVVVKPTRWCETRDFPSQHAMTAFCRYLRTYVDTQLVYLTRLKEMEGRRMIG